MGGDQGAPPEDGIAHRAIKPEDDEFAEGDQLDGDQALPDEPSQSIEIQEEDDYDDEDGAAFLKEAVQPPAAKQSVKDLVRQKSTASKASRTSQKREAGWAGNGVGSGTLQQQKKANEQAISRKTIQPQNPVRLFDIKK